MSIALLIGSEEVPAPGLLTRCCGESSTGAPVSAVGEAAVRAARSPCTCACCSSAWARSCACAIHACASRSDATEAGMGAPASVAPGAATRADIHACASSSEVTEGGGLLTGREADGPIGDGGPFTTKLRLPALAAVVAGEAGPIIGDEYCAGGCVMGTSSCCAPLGGDTRGGGSRVLGMLCSRCDGLPPPSMPASPSSAPPSSRSVGGARGEDGLSIPVGRKSGCHEQVEQREGLRDC